MLPIPGIKRVKTDGGAHFLVLQRYFSRLLARRQDGAREPVWYELLHLRHKRVSAWVIRGLHAHLVLESMFADMLLPLHPPNPRVYGCLDTKLLVLQQGITVQASPCDVFSAQLLFSRSTAHAKQIYLVRVPCFASVRRAFYRVPVSES